METATRLTDRPLGPVPVPNATAPMPAPQLTATASYLLSEDGRKASLLAGGDGRAVQHIPIHVPASRLHLVSVDRNGVARLKLRPRYEVDDQQQVTRIDAAPVFDVPPSLEDLFRTAARNHELERALVANRTAERAKRRETDREFRERIAQAFLSDKTQRAKAHPAPMPMSCILVTDRGRLTFDVATDIGPAKDVPPEAHRRFRADLRAKREQNLQQRQAQLAVHEEKRKFIAAWIAEHGTEEQKERQAAGVLPMAEAIEAISDQVFAPIDHLPRYRRDGVEQLQAHLRQLPGHADAMVTADAISISTTVAQTATQAEWHVLQEIRNLIDEVTAVVRVHHVKSKSDTGATVMLRSVLVTKRAGPLLLRRECEAPR